MIAIYLAGPITAGNQFINVRRALLDASQLRARGIAAFVPHRSILDEMATGETAYEAWMAEDFEWIARCDALVRMPGESKGADREVEEARRLGKPVFFGVAEFLDAIDAQRADVVPCRPAPDVAAKLEHSRRIIAGIREAEAPPSPPDPYGIAAARAWREKAYKGRGQGEGEKTQPEASGKAGKRDG